MHPSNKYVNVNITSSNYYSLETRERCQRAITLDIEGRKIAQYVIYIKEEIQALQKAVQLSCATAEKQAELEALGQELKELDKKYWLHERELYSLKLSMRRGPLAIAYNAHRENPLWHMSSWLRSDCAGGGGGGFAVDAIADVVRKPATPIESYALGILRSIALLHLESKIR